ncbi:MAG: 2-C-methyl-D-erythritol 2,4-cyclodiphosphate synthase [Ruminococcaceae bacterium]|nr:2-C-methyl-D-erythritol 2,4-cyclodiphosphate synthase [Oscillospiraceae bacterium]
MMRIGHGYDAHRFDEERPLYLGGVPISETGGLLGHSDADVALHALMDAMLGALALGDIGKFFPPTDATWKDVRSTELLRIVCKKIAEAGYTLGNADITVVAQKPRLSPYIDRMRRAIADVAGTEISNISVKATTTERMGFTGREEGIAAEAVCLLYKNK